MLKEKFEYYNSIVGTKGERLSSLYRFRNKPNSDYPQIYFPYESVLDHEVRLVTQTKQLLEGIIPQEDILEIQEILIAHDVKELFDGDISRLDQESVESLTCDEDKENIFLPGDLERYRDFLRAQAHLEIKHSDPKYYEVSEDELPHNYYPLVARLLDTIDGNYYAFALLANYAHKVGGESPDKNLQRMLDVSYMYVNRTRQQYLDRVILLNGVYDVDLYNLFLYLQDVESALIYNFSNEIRSQGYRTTSVL